MKALLFIAVGMTSCQRLPLHSSSHWCESPVEQLSWLHQLVGNVQSYAERAGWEMHQDRYKGREVFVLYLIVPRSEKSTFIMYSHHGEILQQGPLAQSAILPELREDRLLVGANGHLIDRK